MDPLFFQGVDIYEHHLHRRTHRPAYFGGAAREILDNGENCLPRDSLSPIRGIREGDSLDHFNIAPSLALSASCVPVDSMRCSSGMGHHRHGTLTIARSKSDSLGLSSNSSPARHQGTSTIRCRMSFDASLTSLLAEIDKPKNFNGTEIVRCKRRSLPRQRRDVTISGEE